MRRSLRSAVVIAALLTACAQAPAISPSAAAPSAGQTNLFESPVYRYAIELPDAVVGAWKPAASQWDGTSRIDSGGTFVDSIRVPDGILLLYGTTLWTGTLTEFADHAHANGVEHDTCIRAPETTDSVEIGGEPALVYTARCAGTLVIRVSFLRDGFGLVAAEIVDAAAEEEAVARLIELLEGLSWRP